jgi:heme exporter protein B
MKKIFLQEFKLQNKLYNSTKYLFIFFTFCLLSTTFANSPAQVQTYGVVFSVICIPLALISISNILIKPDITDGTLELLLTSFQSEKIILAKYLAITISGLIGFLLTIPIIYLLFNVEKLSLLVIITCGALLIITSSALIILVSSIQAYFRSNTNFLSVFIMPLIIPNIILSGIAINDNSTNLLMLIVGIDIIITPAALYLSNYLMNNIYNM